MTRPIGETELRQADDSARFIADHQEAGLPHLVVVQFKEDAGRGQIRQAVLELLGHTAVKRIGLAPFKDDGHGPDRRAS